MKAIKLCRLILPLALLTGCATHANPPAPKPAALESIEWCDVWISHANETNLPRVLLIGDSIVRDYYPGVEKLLAGKAHVGRLSSSAFISDPALHRQIETVLREYHFDIIHFNNGMHGWQHSEAEYAAAFPGLLATLKAGAPDAKLIWGSTTTLKVSPHLSPGDQTQASDERIAARNEIALQHVRPLGIEVDDLSAISLGHPEYHSDNVHFNEQGIALQSVQVAGHIEKMLKH